MKGANDMANKWKRMKRSKPRTGPTRGKYRQMWKVQIRNMISGEEETPHGGAISAVDIDGDSSALAA